MALTRQRDNIHWTRHKLLSYNKTFNYAVSGRGPGKTTDTMDYIMSQHKKGYMVVILKRQIVDISDTTISDLANAYNILQDEDNKIELTYKKGDMNKGICDVYIKGEDVPFFRMVALSNPLYRLKGMAFDRPLTLIVFDEYKISGKEKYLKDEYTKFSELYATLCRFGVEKNGDIIPPKVLFLGNNYSLTDPYLANMKVPIIKIKPGIIITGDNWAFEDIKITDELREYLLKQNPLFNFGNDAYNKYALEGISVSDQRIKVCEKLPQDYRLWAVFYIEDKYLGIYINKLDGTPKDNFFWISVLEDYTASKRRDVACFDTESLVDGTYLLSNTERARFALLTVAFRNRKILYKSIYEGYLFEQIYELL